MAMKKYVVQESGQVTLPLEFRKKYDVKPGDEITFTETEEGLLISTKELMLHRLLDDIGQGLREQGLSLEDMIERGRQIRGEMLKEDYGIEAPDDDA